MEATEAVTTVSAVDQPLFQPAVAATARSTPSVDPLAGMKEKAADELFARIGTRLNDSTLTEDQLHQLARAELAEIVTGEQLALSTAERNRLIDDIGADVLGYGPLEPLLEDPSVSEIMVNRFDQLYVERNGRLTETPHRFTGEPQLRRVIERIVARVGRRIDESSPLVDARLEDGSRVNAIIPPLAVNGSSLTIRKFAGTPYTSEDLIRFGTLTPEIAAVLDAAVQAKMNILVSGGTGTGKTTLLNVLSAFIPSDERIITIEDAVELQLQQQHVVRLEARPSNIEGRGEITIRDLVRNSLRMRPDRIVVGEVRGAESLDMLQAMNTGHEGSISTVHANSPRDAVARMETLVLMAGMDLPLRAIREQMPRPSTSSCRSLDTRMACVGSPTSPRCTAWKGTSSRCRTPSRSITRPASTPMVDCWDESSRLAFAPDSRAHRRSRYCPSGITLRSRLSRDARRDQMNPVVLVTGLTICLLAALVLVFFTVAPSPPRVARDRRVAPGTEHVSLLTRVTVQTTGVIESASSKRRSRLFGAEELELAGLKSSAVAIRRARRLVRERVRIARCRPRSREWHVDRVGHHLRDPDAGGREDHPDRSNLAPSSEVRRPDR